MFQIYNLQIDQNQKKLSFEWSTLYQHNKGIIDQ